MAYGLRTPFTFNLSLGKKLKEELSVVKPEELYEAQLFLPINKILLGNGRAPMLMHRL